LDEKGKVIEEIRGLEEIDKCKTFDKGNGKFGTGGLETKLEAAKIVVKNDGVCIIGNISKSIPDLLSGNVPRTIIYGEEKI